jgi:hypothetical protein
VRVGTNGHQALNFDGAGTELLRQIAQHGGGADNNRSSGGNRLRSTGTREKYEKEQ